MLIVISVVAALAGVLTGLLAGIVAHQRVEISMRQDLVEDLREREIALTRMLAACEEQALAHETSINMILKELP